ncbi:ABC transporter substrate-binding protein [Amycolatopsis suaedae]|uniref:ABC transporter substrate-binding protein n=1 Tax=Amycolatopsis suaedae TaxID=2510978 RepID=A0A4Q7JEW5_9PSEU|nr:ABC transporter substrate-binding protein [Amycolatopsis suaedae]RZQ65333.1 ABC transporter substrate-binding protein [Amycolatopsis suaedae]
MRTTVGSVLTSIALLGTLGGCGLLGGESDPAPAQGDGAVEKPKIRVGVLPVVDVAPLYQAIDKGYFKEQGVEVEAVVVQSGPAAVQGVVGGDLDIAFTSYPGVLGAQAKGVAEMKVVADAYAARPGHMMLVSSPKSAFKKPEQAAGKKIAVTSRGSISDLSVMSVLKTHGVDINTIQWVQMGLPEMGPAMDRGDIDAAVAVEPFVTNTAKTISAVPILDACSGPTADLPMSGWGAVSKFTNANPKTVAAFQRGLAKGVADVQDRAVLEPILTKYVKIPADTAPLVTIAEYPRSLDAVRIQRVADLMHEFGVTPQRLDVAPMLMPSPSA